MMPRIAQRPTEIHGFDARGVHAGSAHQGFDGRWQCFKAKSKDTATFNYQDEAEEWLRKNTDSVSFQYCRNKRY